MTPEADGDRAGRDTTAPILEGRVAIVTGGSSGIGRATCLALARAGANVMVVGTNRSRISAVVETLASSGRAHRGMALDVSSEADMEAMADDALARFGRIDLLVAAAAILRPLGQGPKRLADTSLAEWQEVLDVNLRGIFLSNRAVARRMIAQGSGDIVNISSVSGLRGLAHDAPYCASKFALLGLAKSLDAELRGHGIRVHVVFPDATDTPIWAQNRPVPMPANAIPAERVADLILHIVTRPGDAILPGAVIAPFKARSRLRADPAGTVPERGGRGW